MKKLFLLIGLLFLITPAFSIVRLGGNLLDGLDSTSFMRVDGNVTQSANGLKTFQNLVDLNGNAQVDGNLLIRGKSFGTIPEDIGLGNIFFTATGCGILGPSSILSPGAFVFNCPGSVFSFLQQVIIKAVLSIDEYIEHAGDTDTFFRFRTDRLTAVAGNLEFWDADEGPANDVFTLGGGANIRVVVGNSTQDFNVTARRTTFNNDVNFAKTINVDQNYKFKNVNGLTKTLNVGACTIDVNGGIITASTC